MNRKVAVFFQRGAREGIKGLGGSEEQAILIKRNTRKSIKKRCQPAGPLPGNEQSQIGQAAEKPDAPAAAAEQEKQQ